MHVEAACTTRIQAHHQRLRPWCPDSPTDGLHAATLALTWPYHSDPQFVSPYPAATALAAGYTGSRYFLNASQLKWGQDNVLAIRVDATHPDGWYSLCSAQTYTHTRAGAHTDIQTCRLRVQIFIHALFIPTHMRVHNAVAASRARTNTRHKCIRAQAFMYTDKHAYAYMHTCAYRYSTHLHVYTYVYNFVLMSALTYTDTHAHILVPKHCRGSLYLLSAH